MKRQLATNAVVAPVLVERKQKQAQTKLLELFGKVPYDPAYDYKAQRGVKAAGAKL